MKAIFDSKNVLLCFVNDKKMPELVEKYRKEGYNIQNVDICSICKGSGYEVKSKNGKGTLI